MDASEIAKAAPELGKIAAELGFTDAVRRMLGPAIDEVGEILRDRVRLYRYGRQAKLLEKFDRITQEAGFKPQAVPPKILFPLLEAASFEDDETLHDMWAALLSNAASPDGQRKVKPGFIAILRQMDPDEARLLKWLQIRDVDYQGGMSAYVFSQAERELGFSGGDGRHRSPWFLACVDGLEAQQLLRRHYFSPSEMDSRSTHDSQSLNFTFMLTQRAVEFLTACQAPKPKP